MSQSSSVEDFLSQNRCVREWLEALRGPCETLKQWNARRTFLLQNLDLDQDRTPEPGPQLDRLLAHSMVWANHVFMGCRYPPSVMDRVLQMAEGIEVTDAPQFITRDQIMKRLNHTDSDVCLKKSKTEEINSKPPASTQKSERSGPSAQAPSLLQPFFNRLYKAVCWRRVSAGPDADPVSLLRSCVQSCKQDLSLVLVPLQDLVGGAGGGAGGRGQQDGHVCEVRCQGVYLGTGYGRDEDAARSLASREALKLFQGRNVVVKICRRKFRGREIEDLVLLDDEPRSHAFPPAVSHPFSSA